jgi:hypothetical protein
MLPLDSFERTAPRPTHTLLEPSFGGSCSIDGTLQCHIFLAIASPPAPSAPTRDSCLLLHSPLVETAPCSQISGGTLPSYRD